MAHSTSNPVARFIVNKDCTLVLFSKKPEHVQAICQGVNRLSYWDFHKYLPLALAFSSKKRSLPSPSGVNSLVFAEKPTIQQSIFKPSSGSRISSFLADVPSYAFPVLESLCRLGVQGRKSAKQASPCISKRFPRFIVGKSKFQESSH
jgi:hypothetical protein